MFGIEVVRLDFGFMFSVAQPIFLLLLLGLPLFWLIRRRGRRSTAAACLAVRSVVFALIVLALAGVGVPSVAPGVGIVAILDQSPSVSESAKAEQQQVLEALQEAGGSDRVTSISYTSADYEDQKTLGHAIVRAAAACPSDRPGRIVLITDGIAADPPTAITAARRTAGGGTPLDIMLVGTEREPEVQINAAQFPDAPVPGQAFNVDFEVVSNVSQDVNFRLYRDEVLVDERSATLGTSSETLTFDNLVATEGRATYRLEASPSADTLVENNSAAATVESGSPQRVLVLDPQPDRIRRVADVLELAGFAVDVRPPQAAPDSLEELADFELVVLSDVSAESLGFHRADILSRWVNDLGGGLFIAGGETAFAAGGYARTALEDLSPVAIDYEDRADLPVSALIIVLDRSGSMSTLVGGRTKMALANEGTVRAMDALQSKDLFGVMAVDTEIYTVVPLGTLSDRSAVSLKILGINPGGGGIYVTRALLAAFQALENADARLEHIILFSDAADVEEKATGSSADTAVSALDVASALLSRRITLSVVALGTERDKDTEFLRYLADRGGGRFYLTADALALPRIFAEETLRATRASVVEEPVSPVPNAEGDFLSGIDWANAPFLLGFNATRPKPESTLQVATDTGAPLLASHPFGLGRVTAFTSDIKGRWSADWLDWEGFDKLLVQIARSLARKAPAEGLRASIHRDGSTTRIEIDFTDAQGQFVNGATVTVSAADGTTRVARQIAPGRYEAVFDSTGDQTFAISAGDGSAPVNIHGKTQVNPEFLVLDDATDFVTELARAGNGLVDPTPSEVFRPTQRIGSYTTPITPWLLGLAILLVPVDVWLRKARPGSSQM